MRIDGLESNLDTKKPVRVATTGPITLSGLQTVDGVALAVNDRVLVKDQSNKVENGIYTVTSSTWNRSYDAKDNRSVTQGMSVSVDDGTTQADTQWNLTTNSPQVNVTDLTFKKVVDSAVLTRTSDGIPEGNGNKYYTDARARAAFSASGNLSYNSNTGVFSYTTPKTDGITEGTSNLYFSNARARAAVSASGSIAYNATTGVFSYTTPTTDGIAEGTTNQYFTTARARAAITAGGNISYVNGVISYTTPTSDGITEGTTNKYYTDARSRAAISVAGYLTYNSTTGVISHSTLVSDGVVEGTTNKYYTDARARAAVSVSGNLSYNATTGVISYTTPTYTTTNVAEGTNLYYTNARARAAISATGNLSYDNVNGILSYTSPAVTGDGTMAAGSSVFTLANTGVSAGTYTIITTNAKGLVTGGKKQQVFTGTVAQTSGTTIIPFDNTVPLITEGTQLFSQAIVPQSTASKFNIVFTPTVDASAGRTITVAVFRGSTFVSASMYYSFGASTGQIAINIIDAPASATAVTYSVRIGASSAATWYVGRGSGQTLGGVNPSTWTITEIL